MNDPRYRQTVDDRYTGEPEPREADEGYADYDQYKDERLRDELEDEDLL